MRFWRYAGCLPLLAYVLCAQQPDAAQVLSLSVSYRTMAGSTQLAPDIKAEAQKLRESAMVASQAGRYGEALRHLHHGMSLMRGVAWTPSVELASSLVLKTDHALCEPQQKIRVRLDQIFSPVQPEARSLRATLRLQGPEGSKYAELGRWERAGAEWSATVTMPEVATGKYGLELALSAKDAPTSATVLTKRVGIVVHPGLRSTAESIRTRLAKVKAAPSSALWTAQYVAELYDLADRGERDPALFDFAREFAYADEILTALESGMDPFANRTGDMRRAYKSEADGTLQPYRLNVPRSYTRDREYGLVVALHGMGGDENSMFDRYGNGAVVREAERHSYIVVCPKGRGPASMYRGTAEKDVMDVIAQVRAAYRVDADRIYMFGHSMGGYGTWSIAMNQPQVFAALAPIAGGGNPNDMQKILHIPQLVVHGDKDVTVPVTASRSMVEAAKKLNAPVKYLEIPGGGHNDVVVPALPEVFSWFNSHRRGQASAAVAH